MMKLSKPKQTLHTLLDLLPNINSKLSRTSKHCLCDTTNNSCNCYYLYFILRRGEFPRR